MGYSISSVNQTDSKTQMKRQARRPLGRYTRGKPCSLNPRPPDFSLVFEMVPATPEHASQGIFDLEAICFGCHWGLSRQLEQKFFLEAHAIKSPFLCACERQSEQFEQGKTCCHMNYTIVYIQEPKKALLANRQHSFLQLFA